MMSSLGRETSTLVKEDLKTGDVVETVWENDKCDVGALVLDEDTKELRAVGIIMHVPNMTFLMRI